MLQRFMANFTTGILALLPLLITIALVGFLVGKLNAVIGPSSAFGQFLYRLVNEDTAKLSLGYLLSVLIVVLFIWIVGYIARRYAGRGVTRIATLIVGRVPFINKVYTSAEQVVELFARKDKDSASALSNVVMVRIANLHVLGMLSSPEPVQIKGVPHYIVFLPGTPVPATGQNLLIPEEDIFDVDVSVEEMTKILLSLGSLGPGIMNSKSQLILPGLGGNSGAAGIQ
jgi:uncharacterized membrane protein